MGKFSGCLLASDYDATLTCSGGYIPDEVRAAVNYFKQEGGLFTVCTGRTRQGFHDYSPELINAPVLHANGAMAYDHKEQKTVFEVAIQKKDADVIRKIAFEFKGAGVEFYSDSFRSYVINPDEHNVKHFQFQNINDFITVDDVVDEAFPCVKVMVYIGKERSAEFMKYLDSIDMGEMKYIPQYNDFIEIVSAKTDKGKGLMKLAECLGIKENRVFSIGDGNNDVDMLKAAYIGFVPENGCEAAKKAGDIIVKSNDEFAVADTISKIEEIIESE